MITIYVDSYDTAAEVRKFIRDTLNTFGCISIDEILYVAGCQNSPYTYRNMLLYKEAEQTSIIPIYSDEIENSFKCCKLIIPSDKYTATFNPINKNDSTTKHSAFIPKCTPKPTNYLPEIKNVKFNGPATIVFWTDGTKTVVKCQDGDDYSEEVGLAMCIVKKAFGNTSKYNDIFKKWCPSYDSETDDDEYFSEAYKQFRNYVLKTFNEII